MFDPLDLFLTLQLIGQGGPFPPRASVARHGDALRVGMESDCELHPCDSPAGHARCYWDRRGVHLECIQG
jgi:hypothetical protein